MATQPTSPFQESATMPVFSPEGKLANVPSANYDKALANGFRRAVSMVSPEGKQAYLPEEKVQDALALKFKHSMGGTGASWEPPPAKEPSGYLDTANEYYNAPAKLGEGLGHRLLRSGGRTAMMVPNLVQAAVGGPSEEEKAKGFAPPVLGDQGSLTNLPANAFDRVLSLPFKHLAVDPSRQSYQQIQGDVQQAEEAQGHPLSTPQQAVRGAEEGISMVPLLGPLLLSIARRIDPGTAPGAPPPDIAGGVADALTMHALPEIQREASPGGRLPGAPEAGELALPATRAALGKVAEKFPQAVQTVRGAISPEAMTAEQAATKAFRPRNSKANWQQEVASALPDARRAADALKLDPNAMTLDDALAATSQAKKDVWGEYERNFKQPNQDVAVDTTSVAGALRKTLSDRQIEQNPNFADRINEIADDYSGRKMSLQDVEDRVRELNNETRGIEAKYLTDKRAAKLDPQNAPLFAERDTLRQLMLDKMDELSGPGAAQLRKRWGALNSLEDVVSRRIPVAQRQVPNSLPSVLAKAYAAGKVARGVFTLNPADILEGGVSLLSQRKSALLNDPDYLTQLAFRKTVPRSPFVPRFQGDYQAPAASAPPVPPVVPKQLYGMQFEHMQPVDGEYVQPPAPPIKGLLNRGQYNQPPKGAEDFEFNQPQLPAKASAIPLRAIPDEATVESQHAPFNATLYSNRGPQGFEGKPSLKSAFFGEGYYFGRTHDGVKNLVTVPGESRRVLSADVNLKKPLMWDGQLQQGEVSALAKASLEASKKLETVTPEQERGILGAKTTYELNRAMTKVGNGQLAGHFINQGARSLGYDGLVTDGQVVAFNRNGLTPKESNANVPVPVEPNEPQRPVVQGAGAGNDEQLPGGISGRIQGSDQPQRATQSQRRGTSAVAQAQIDDAQSYGYKVKLIDKPPKGYTAKHFPDRKVIEVYTRGRSPEQIASSLNHEIGHVVDYARRGIVADPMGDSIRSEHTGELGPMNDAQTYFRMGPKVKEAAAIRKEIPRKDGAAQTQKEVYADAYKLYRDNPGRLQEIAPTISKELSDFAASRTGGQPKTSGYGNDTQVLTSGQNLPGKYRVVEADSLIPSHDAGTFAPNPKYPQGVQERTYHTSKEAQARVIQQAQQYDPNYTINTNPDAVNGPPVVTKDGIVLGGNSRTMSTQRLYSAGRGEAYKNELVRQAGTFGLDSQQIAKMNRPVLVREVTPTGGAEGMRRLGADLNKSMTGALGVQEKAVSAGRSIKPETLDSIGKMRDDLGEGATLRDVLREHGKEVLGMLTRDGAVTDRERPQLIDTGTGGLSEEGKTFVERALLGSVVDDPVLMEKTPKNILDKVGSSLGELSSLSARDDHWNIVPLIREALADHAEMASTGNNMATYLNQPRMFGAQRSPAVEAVVRNLGGKPKAVKQALRDFADAARMNQPGQATLGLMRVPTASEAFNEAFGSDVTEDQLIDAIRDSMAKETPHDVQRFKK